MDKYKSDEGFYCIVCETQLLFDSETVGCECATRNLVHENDRWPRYWYKASFEIWIEPIGD